MISCDLLTSLPPHQFLDMHRSEDPTVSALFFEPSKSEGGPSGSSKETGMHPLRFTEWGDMYMFMAVMTHSILTTVPFYTFFSPCATFQPIPLFINADTDN